jgi:hypothetical protein
MSLYVNTLAGFRILYPAGWVYESENGDVYFAETEEILRYSSWEEGPILGIGVGSPDEMELQFGPVETVELLLDSVLEGMQEEEWTAIGEAETWTFGEVPGAGAEIGWVDDLTGIPIRGYVVAAAGEEVVGIALAASPDDAWPSYEPVFRDMFASLEFFPPEIPEPVEKGAIQPGEGVQGTLPMGGVDVWSFDAQKGQYLTIRMDAVDSLVLDPYLELYDGNENLVAYDDDASQDTNSPLILDFPVPASGTYYIHALTYSGEGDYALLLEVADEPSGGGAIQYGETVEGALAGWGQHEWVFKGQEGDVVTIAMSAANEELDCYLELYAPDDILLTDDDDSGEGFDALIEYYELPSSGDYCILALGGLFSAAGKYELALERTDMVVEGILSYGDTVEVTLEPGTRHHWLFEGQAGDVVTISMVASDEGMDTYLELFAPDGVRVMADDDGGGDGDAEISGFELPLGGTYRIVARGYADDDVGGYALTLTGGP